MDNPRQLLEQKLLHQRDVKVDILDIDSALDREDIIRKYSRTCAFWYFAERYYQVDNPYADEITLELARQIIDEHYEQSIQSINVTFEHDSELRNDIFSRIELYKWKEHHYGNSRKNIKPYVSLY